LVAYFILPLIMTACYGFMMLIGSLSEYRHTGKFCMLCSCCAGRCDCCAPHDHTHDASSGEGVGKGKGLEEDGDSIVVTSPPEEMQMVGAGGAKAP
jgi:hypothetical protein